MKNLKKVLWIVAIVVLASLLFLKVAHAQTISKPFQGGTGIGSTTAGHVGDCLTVLDDSPFTYTLGDCGGSAGVAWGDITGTLSAQTDLQSALDAKFDNITDFTGTLTNTKYCIFTTGTGIVCNSEGGTGAPTDVDYLVGTATGALSAEIVVGTSPGGELGGTWASPTLDDSITTTGWVMGNFSGTTYTGAVSGNASTATALAADPADCATSTHFAVGIIASGVATCEAISDADVPNNITIDLATLASTVTTNANLTGAITSTGNATILGSFNTSAANTALSDNDFATIAGSETLTSKTLTTPVINGTITGTGQSTGATASTIAMRDSSGNLTADNWLGGYTTTATAAGTTTLTVDSTFLQYFTGATTQTVTLPVVSTLALGTQYVIVNNSSGNVTVNSSGGNAVTVLVGSTSTVVTSIATSGTGAAVWSSSYSGANVASGKKLTVSNTLTFTGTDSSSVAFGTGGTVLYSGGALGTPSSGTVTNLTGTASININGTVGATTPSTVVGTTITANTMFAADANDGSVLGAAGTAFSDLFLAETGVINWDSGDLTLTQSGDTLTVAGGDLLVTTAGTAATSVATLQGTQTMTNKTLTSPTLTTPSAFTTGGAITLAENTSIALDPAGSADGKYSGTTVTGTGGATIAFGDLVTLDKDDSRWELVDVSVAAAATGDARGIMGIAVTSSSDGGAITVLLQGIVRADANFPALTIGAAVYATTAGDITVTQPSTTDHVIRVMGFALTADEIYFNPSGDYITRN